MLDIQETMTGRQDAGSIGAVRAAPGAVQPAGSGWFIRIREKTYGPFSAGQMKSYVTEGRLNPASRVSPSADGPFSAIRETAALADTLQGALAERARLCNEAANFIIIVRAPAPAEAALWRSLPECLEKLGRYTQPMPGTWLLRSAQPLAAVRSALTGVLPRTVQVIVLETREARLDWIGFDDDIQQTAGRVWNAALA